MTLQFTRTVEDYVALWHLHSARSRKLRRARLWTLALAPTLWVVFGALLYTHSPYGHIALSATLLAVLSTVALYAAVPHLGEAATRRNVKAHPDALGEVEMEIVSDGVVSRKGNHQLKTVWGGIGDIVTEGDCTFIYIAEDASFIIPHRRITSGNYVLFMQELARQIEAHTLALLNAPSGVVPQVAVATQTAVEAETLRTRRGRV